jgi:hypothetical protein
LDKPLVVQYGIWIWGVLQGDLGTAIIMRRPVADLLATAVDALGGTQRPGQVQMAEAVAHDRTGLLVPPDRPEELTAAFARVLADGALRERLGAEGRRWAGRTSWAAAATTLFGPGPATHL